MTTNWIEKQIDIYGNKIVEITKDYIEGEFFEEERNKRYREAGHLFKDSITTLLEKKVEDYVKKIEYVMKKDEQVHGCQYNDKKEIDIYFDGFKNGRAMMRIDLLNIIKQK